MLKKVVSQADGPIFMDMTSGRKAMAALMLLIGELFPGKVEKVYYSFLTDADYTDFPHPVIPLQVTHLYDLMEK
ncbi:MAG: hypothetical protein D6743_19305 [Calditrichaeota bacterium]|nr:MAG: hypothetical protein D6743_19305 [Calditrichota bacterium]